MLASFNRRRKIKAESRQIPQKFAARLKFAYCYIYCIQSELMNVSAGVDYVYN